MKVTLPSLLVITAAIGCASGTPTSTTATRIDNVAALNGARLELVEEGGIAAFSTTYVVRHDDRVFSFSRRHICSTSCPAPLDTASGTLPQSASDSLFNVVVNAQPGTLKDDYGATPNSADMITYTLRVTLDNATKTIRADDGTMPAAMRKMVEVIHGIIPSS